MQILKCSAYLFVLILGQLLIASGCTYFKTKHAQKQNLNKKRLIPFLKISVFFLFAGDPREMDVHNDFKRETLFYEQAKEAVMQAMARLHADGVTTKRPDDYFAEMAKKDDHMKRVSSLFFDHLLTWPNSKAGVPNLSLAMYPFNISTDEHVPLKFLSMAGIDFLPNILS